MRLGTSGLAAVVALALATSPVAAETAPATGAPPADQKKINAGEKSADSGGGATVTTMALGVALGKWAREAKNPVALAVAGTLVSGAGAKPVDKVPEKVAAAAAAARPSDKKPTAPNGDRLIAEAKTMAAGNDKVLAAIDQVVAAAPKAMGRVGGPSYWEDCVDARHTDEYRNLRFGGGKQMSIAVSGDGDTDLDCYVYDENGNLVDSDTDDTDDCVLSNVPRWTGNFTLRIRNLGTAYNCYEVLTN